MAELVQRIAGLLLSSIGSTYGSEPPRARSAPGPPAPAHGRRGPRSVAEWLADLRRDSASAAGSLLRTAGLLRQLPLVAHAVLEGLLTPAQAQVLTRLVDEIVHAEALLEPHQNMLLIAALLELVALRQWVAHQIRPTTR